MTSNPAATFSRTQVVWQFPPGNDISLKGRSLTLVRGSVTAATLDGITAGGFAADSSFQFNPPTFLNLSNLSVEFLIQPSALTATGFILRAGNPGNAQDVGLGIRLFLTGGNIVWSMLKRGALTPTGVANVVQASNASSTIAFDRIYHMVAVAASGQDNRIYINGDLLTLTHVNALTDGAPSTAGPLFGSIPIDPTYELAIGDPSIGADGFLGILGRMVVYPYPVTASQAGAGTRLQLDQATAINLGQPTAAGGANHGPVAVPFLATGSVAENANIDIDVASQSFDADGGTLTAFRPTTPVPDQGISSITGTGLLRYTPNGGTGGGLPHRVPFGVRDLSLASSSLLKVMVTAPLPPPTGEFPSTVGDQVRTVNAAGDFNAAYAASGPGDHVVVADGVSLGNRTLNRNGNAGYENLIVIRAATRQGASARFNITGNNQFIYGFSGVDFDLSGDFVTFRRMRWSGKNVTNAFGYICRMDTSDSRWEYCTFSTASCGGLRWDTASFRDTLQFCHFLNINSIAGDFACESLCLGQGYQEEARVANHLVVDCLFENCNTNSATPNPTENETISNKSASNIFRRVQFHNSQNLNMRFGENCQVLGCVVPAGTNAGNITFRGRNHIANNCLGQIQAFNGDFVSHSGDQGNTSYFPNCIGLQIIHGPPTGADGRIVLDTAVTNRPVQPTGTSIAGRTGTPNVTPASAPPPRTITATSGVTPTTQASFPTGLSINNTVVGINGVVPP